MVAALLGWLGMAGTFAAYALQWQGRLSSDSVRYALLNVVGGALGGIASLLYGAWPPAASNFVWAAIGLAALARALRRTSEPTQPQDDQPASGPLPLPAVA